MDTFEKLEYKINAGIDSAKAEKEYRLSDRIELPLKGIQGEKIYLTGEKRFAKRIQEIRAMYDKMPEGHRVTAVILLDAHSSATIEGAHTTVEHMKKCLTSPKTKDEIMVANTYKACGYAYEHQINKSNIRDFWEMIIEGVCENLSTAGTQYRSGMVYIGNETKTVHTPAMPDKIPDLMDSLFAFEKDSKIDPIIKSFIFHFYFVYVHPFCDGNGRTARAINNSQLFFSGLPKIKSIAMATAINRDLNAYYKSIEDCEKHIGGRKDDKWLDVSPFVEYMIGIFENAITDSILANNLLSEKEQLILDRMNLTGKNAEITVRKAMEIVKLSESGTRNLLLRLANEGYLEINQDTKPYIYKLAPHI